MNIPDYRKYILVFLITGAIFATALYVSNLINNKRVAELRSIENQIAINILSSETQYSLLAERSCKDLRENSALSSELNGLTERLSFTEKSLGTKNEEVITLKRYYSLLQIKDYLLMKRVSEKCGIEPITVLYFYSNKGDCPLCEKTGLVLDHLRSQYPQVRVYAFDYNLDVSAIRTLISLFRVENKLPALVFGDEMVVYGLSSTDDFEKALPVLKKLKAEKEKEELQAQSATTSIEKK